MKISAISKGELIKLFERCKLHRCGKYCRISLNGHSISGFQINGFYKSFDDSEVLKRYLNNIGDK